MLLLLKPKATLAGAGVVAACAAGAQAATTSVKHSADSTRNTLVELFMMISVRLGAKPLHGEGGFSHLYEAIAVSETPTAKLPCKTAYPLRLLCVAARPTTGTRRLRPTRRRCLTRR